MLKDFISLLFPDQCSGCENTLNTDKELICLTCLSNLPRTNFDFDNENPVAQKFWGKVPIHKAIALLNFNQHGLTQQLIHQLKYQGNQQLGVLLGKLLGKEIGDRIKEESIDLVLPVPLHSRRRRKRGYNQSDLIAEGVADALHIERDSTSLIRRTNNESQTRKNLFQRWKNVETIFEVKSLNQLRDKHVLLVDDVITTGATLEACTQQLIKAENIKVSVATLAITV